MPDILIIDDEDHIRKLYTDFLTREGYSVESVADESEALKILSEKEFDLVILDIELEGESGLEVLKRLKSDHPELPVILNTAYAVYKSDFHTWMADAYLLKSSDLNSMKAKVREMVGV
ncbi:MAG: response regulator [Candidatus Zixiibacteriota bacterium]|nr:MAG: response regulator [candidate division Zixibacteria bacterium]